MYSIYIEKKSWITHTSLLALELWKGTLNFFFMYFGIFGKKILPYSQQVLFCSTGKK